MKKIQYHGFRDLKTYQLAFKLALEIHEVTRTFPAEEKYSLVDQMRRSSRSVAANIAEAWRKRKYKRAFIYKLTDSSGEASETEVWLDFSKYLGYLEPAKHRELVEKYNEVGKMLTGMIDKADKFCP
ncbi:MAG: four helix bundle protein [Thermodesulfobacteriota bacterium]